jgi:hypothetical protein
MATAPLPTKNMPLSVEIFCAAMQQQVALADFARIIDVHPDILYDVLAGRLNSADSDTLNALAKAIKRDPQQLDLTTALFHESFGAWLKRNMEGITQHALRARAQLDTQTLKRFLNRGALPDSDQAERISRALYIDRREIARVVTANMAAASPSQASQEAPKSRATESAELASSGAASQAVAGARRRRASTRQPSAEPASSPSSVAPTPLDETASASAEPYTAVTGASPAENRPRRTSKRAAQVPAPAVAVAAQRRRDASSPIPAVEARQPDRADGSTATAVAQPAGQELRPTTESPRSGKSRSRRQPNQAITLDVAAAVEPDTRIQDGRQAMMEEARALAKTANETAARTRRPKRPSTRGRASATVVEQPPALTETAIARDDGLAAADTSPKRASSRRRPRTTEADVTGTSTSGEVSASLVATTAPSMADQPSADVSRVGTAPLVSAEVAADTTTFQLSPDEVRLIRHWRQLHPHGRRATLHYIGSLLVDD